MFTLGMHLHVLLYCTWFEFQFISLCSVVLSRVTNRHMNFQAVYNEFCML